MFEQEIAKHANVFTISPPDAFIETSDISIRRMNLVVSVMGNCVDRWTSCCSEPFLVVTVTNGHFIRRWRDVCKLLLNLKFCS